MKSYLEDKNTWNSTSIIIYFCKIISTFYKDYLEKLIAMTLFIDSVLLMIKRLAKPLVKPLIYVNMQNVFSYALKSNDDIDTYFT